MKPPVASGPNPDLDLAVSSQVAVLITAGDRDLREQCARVIHEGGSRHDGPFGVLRCSRRVPSNALPILTALDAALAISSGGTLFVDDVGEMNPDAQRRLLDATTSGHVRIIAGSNHSLLTDVSAGRFDEHLFYRLNVLHLTPATSAA